MASWMIRSFIGSTPVDSTSHHSRGSWFAIVLVLWLVESLLCLGPIVNAKTPRPERFDPLPSFVHPPGELVHPCVYLVKSMGGILGGESRIAGDRESFLADSLRKLGVLLHLLNGKYRSQDLSKLLRALLGGDPK